MRALFMAVCAVFLTVPVASYSAPAKWTWLIFLNAKNDLEPLAQITLGQLQPFATNPDVNVIVQVGKLGEPTVKRLKIVTNPQNPTEPSPILEDIGSVDMGDYKSVIDFVHWGVTKFPAKHYMLTFWDHGTGWHDIDDGEPKPPAVPSPADEISHDEKTDHSITTKELGLIFKDFSELIGRKVDIFSSDACYMGSLEVAYEVATYADFYLGSEDIAPLTGWPYHHLLKNLAANPDMSPSALSKLIADEYYRYHINGEVTKREVTYSVYDLGKFSSFVLALRNLGKTVLSANVEQKKEFQKVGVTAMHLTQSDYVDFGSWLGKMKAIPALAAAAPQFEVVEASYKNLIYHNNITPEFKEATGASLWLPATKADITKYQSQYKELKFTRATQWDEVLTALTAHLR
jgi:hypothetical protein